MHKQQKGQRVDVYWTVIEQLYLLSKDTHNFYLYYFIFFPQPIILSHITLYENL